MPSCCISSCPCQACRRFFRSFFMGRFCGYLLRSNPSAGHCRGFFPPSALPGTSFPSLTLLPSGFCEGKPTRWLLAMQGEEQEMEAEARAWLLPSFRQVGGRVASFLTLSPRRDGRREKSSLAGNSCATRFRAAVPSPGSRSSAVSRWCGMRSRKRPQRSCFLSDPSRRAARNLCRSLASARR